MEIINFNSPWNGNSLHSKIHCNYFTTIRIHNSDKYVLNKKYVITYKDKSIKMAQIIKIRQATLSTLSELYFYLDCGYSKENSIKMFETMYRLKPGQVDTLVFDVILLETIK
jgi:hypothetical protein